MTLDVKNPQKAGSKLRANIQYQSHNYTPEDRFKAAMMSAGFEPPKTIIPYRGRIERFSTNGKPGDDGGWYYYHPDGVANGEFGNHRGDGVTHKWIDDVGRELTETEKADIKACTEAARAQRDAGLRIQRQQAAEKASALLAAASPASSGNPYLNTKKVSPSANLLEVDSDILRDVLGYTPKSRGEPLHGIILIVPVMLPDGVLATCELIDEAGRKSALFGGQKGGGFWMTQEVTDIDEVILIGEGAATCLSASQATGYPAVAALSGGNLKAVSQTFRQSYPEAKIVILADVKDGEPYPAAVEAASAVGGVVTAPQFQLGAPNWATDWNDFHCLYGLEATAAAIHSALDMGPASWPDPLPLAAKFDPEPYPVDALPDTIGAAIMEVAGFVKAPIPLVASSALAAVSLACQAQIDVKRAEKLHGPTGVFLLTIADSGERKSTCDSLFTKAIRDYQEAEAEAAKPVLKDYKASMDAWDAKRNGIKEKIRQLAKGDKPTQLMESSLRKLEHEKPEPPRVPRLLYADATPEALAYGLAKQWPSGGIVSAEAGIVFGSHGMGKDSVMRNLALLNQLWDGNSLTIDRRSTDSFTVRGARLTVALQIQDATLLSFFEKSGTLARGTGFIARFLVAWPESTQGTRLYSEAPDNWPKLASFHQRICSILNQPVPIDDDGTLTPVMMTLDPAAKAAWVVFHDEIERELMQGGELYDVRDVASKSADNAARLAALFQLFEHGMGGAIGLDAFESASRIVAWHLSESRRFFGELALPEEMADAAKLDRWLLGHCQREQQSQAGKNYVRQHGPIRDGARLDSAIKELSDLNRLRLEKDGKRLTIYINPALLEAA